MITPTLLWATFGYYDRKNTTRVPRDTREVTCVHQAPSPSFPAPLPGAAMNGVTVTLQVLSYGPLTHGAAGRCTACGRVYFWDAKQAPDVSPERIAALSGGELTDVD